MTEIPLLGVINTDMLVVEETSNGGLNISITGSTSNYYFMNPSVQEQMLSHAAQFDTKRSVRLRDIQTLLDVKSQLEVATTSTKHVEIWQVEKFGLKFYELYKTDLPLLPTADIPGFVRTIMQSDLISLCAKRGFLSSNFFKKYLEDTEVREKVEGLHVYFANDSPIGIAPPGLPPIDIGLPADFPGSRIATFRIYSGPQQFSSLLAFVPSSKC